MLRRVSNCSYVLCCRGQRIPVPWKPAVALWNVDALYGSKRTAAQTRYELHSWQKRQPCSMKWYVGGNGRYNPSKY
jgi:hypothetical protein